MVFYFFFVACFLLLLYFLYKIFCNKEGSKKRACIELVITILTMVLGTLFQYGIDNFPNLPDMIEKWKNSSENAEVITEKPFSTVYGKLEIQ